MAAALLFSPYIRPKWIMLWLRSESGPSPRGWGASKAMVRVNLREPETSKPVKRATIPYIGSDDLTDVETDELAVELGVGQHQPDPTGFASCAALTSGCSVAQSLYGTWRAAVATWHAWAATRTASLAASSR